MISINNDNEIAATTEIIFSRITYSLTLLKSIQGHISGLRKAAGQD
jgi:hypothetical protein